MQFLLESGELFEQTPIQVVYYGISQSRIDSFNKVQTDREDDSSTSFIVLCVARLVPQKNITILLEAFCKLVECSTQTELRIVGRGYLEPSLKMLSQRLGIESRVKWIQESRDIDILMKECDCLVLPSIYEGFGLVLLEAMNCELPIIASSIPTSREVLGEGYFGLFESNSSTSLFLKLKEFMDIGVRRNSLDWQKNRLRLFDIFVTTQEIRELYLKGLNSRGAVK
jgi:glycosyltransferase involved in cell wall biosynthesis